MQCLAEVTRGSLVESEHWGDIVVADGEGLVRASVGDPGRPAYFRSSAKPLQALSAVASGAVDAFGVQGEELAVLCASHAAEDFHLAAVRRVLEKAGVPEAALQCGTQWPGSRTTAQELIRRGREPQPIHNNCSGKHAGMLITAQHLGAPLDTYLELDHPVQQAILGNLQLLTGIKADKFIIGTDGCGAPVHGMALVAMATAYARYASLKLPPAESAAAERLMDAMAQFPKLVAGTGSFNSVFLGAAGRDIVAKGGAEGLYCLGHRRLGHGLAIKIRDGNSRALPPIVMRALEELGWLTDKQRELLHAFERTELRNTQGKVIGEIRASKLQLA